MADELWNQLHLPREPDLVEQSRRRALYRGRERRSAISRGRRGRAYCGHDRRGRYQLFAAWRPDARSNSNLATSFTYASSFAVASATGPNGSAVSGSYDAYGRVSTWTIADGTTTNYTYTFNPNTVKLTVSGRWTKTTADGFGRTTRVENGNGTTTVSIVDTQYAPCACAPLDKLRRASQPYAPGGTPVWTTYTYDGSGRTLTATAT